MTTTGSIVGREVKAYYSQGTTWGTAADSGSEIIITEDGLSYSQNHDNIEESNSTWLKATELGTIDASVNFSQNFRFDDLRGIAMVCGDGNYATVTAQNAGKGDFVHTFYPDEDNYGDFATMAFLKGASIIQTIDSVKFAGLTMRGQPSPNRITINYNTIASNVDNASAVITASDISGMSAAPTGNGGRAYFKNCTVQINDQSSATLATGDALVVSGFEWTVTRSLAADYTNSSGLEVAEPVEDGYMESTISFDLPNFGSTANGFFTDFNAKTAKKLKLTITGAAASSATGTVANAQFMIECPHAEVMDPPDNGYSGPGRIPSRLSLRLLAAETTSDATGMAWVEPFKITAINAQSAKAVA